MRIDSLFSRRCPSGILRLVAEHQDDLVLHVEVAVVVVLKFRSRDSVPANTTGAVTWPFDEKLKGV